MFALMAATAGGAEGGALTNIPPAKADPLHVGMLAPLTGAAARYGESQRNGVQLALDEINNSGGIGGRRLVMNIENTRTEPPTALTAFTRLAERDDLLAIFGSAASLDVPAYLPRVDGAAIPHLLPVAVLPSITDAGSRFTFRSALNDRVAAERMAQFVVQELRASRVALLIEDSAFGETGLMFAAEAERLGVTPMATERLRRGDLDVRAQLTRIQSLGATHVQFWGYYAEYALVARQMRELRFDAVLMGNQAPVTDKTLELGGKALEGVINICRFVPGSSEPAVQSFVTAYQARFGELPDGWAAQSYDGMRILANAMVRGGFTREGIRDALASTRDFPGVTGVISFADNGDATFRETSIVTVSRGRWVPYRAPARR